MSPEDFDYVRRLVFERAAIVLDSDKGYLVTSRLVPVARDQGYDSIGAVVSALRGGRAAELSALVVEAMTTNETSFFRDVHPFDALRDQVIPEVMAARAGARRLNVWCAACSSGQEPYSIAMMLLDNFPELQDWTVRLVATDLSVEMVERARSGTYSQFEVNRGLPARYLPRHFVRNGASWTVSDSIRAMVDFRTMNLIEAWPLLPAMDIVFMRNVLIYFDPDRKRDLLGRVHGVLAGDGYLFLGGAETTINLHDGFERVPINRASCYRRRDPVLAGGSAR